MEKYPLIFLTLLYWVSLTTEQSFGYGEFLNFSSFLFTSIHVNIFLTPFVPTSTLVSLAFVHIFCSYNMSANFCSSVGRAWSTGLAVPGSDLIEILLKRA